MKFSIGEIVQFIGHPGMNACHEKLGEFVSIVFLGGCSNLMCKGDCRVRDSGGEEFCTLQIALRKCPPDSQADSQTDSTEDPGLTRLKKFLHTIKPPVRERV